MKKTIGILLFSFITTILVVKAQTPGTLDSSFNGTGVLGMPYGYTASIIYDLAIQEDQKIVFCGCANMVGGSFNTDIFIGRRNSDGSVDTTFGNNGFIFKDYYGVGPDIAFRIAIQPDEKIIVVGYASIQMQSNYDVMVMRLNTDGSYDNTFNGNGSIVIADPTSIDNAYDVLIQPDQKILVAGSKRMFGGSTVSSGLLVRLNSNGSLDSTFGNAGLVIHSLSPTLNEEFRSIKLLPGGNIIAGGGCGYQLYLAGFYADGSLNLSFGSFGTYVNQTGFQTSHDIVISNNMVFACGTVQNGSGEDAVIMQFDTSGLVNTNFGTNGFTISNLGPYNYTYQLAAQPDGKILVSGGTGMAFTGVRDFFTIRYLQNGDPDLSFGNNGSSIISIGYLYDDAYSIAIQDDGKVLLGGVGKNAFDYYMAIVRLLNDSGAVTTGMPSPLSIGNSLKLYPSPSAGSIVVLEGDYTENTVLNIELFNTKGQLMFHAIENIPASSGYRIQLDFPSNLTEGIYYVRCTTDKNIMVLEYIKNDF